MSEAHPASSTAVPVVNAPPSNNKTTPVSSISTSGVETPAVPVAINAPPASTSSAAAIVHPASTVSATVNPPPVSHVSAPVNTQPASLVVNAPAAILTVAADAPPASVAAHGTVLDEVTQPPREEWFRYTCAEVAVDKGAAESMRSTPDQLGLTVQKAVITKSSNLWDNGITLTYGFITGTPNQQAKVSNVITEWTKYANVRFAQLDSPQSANIRITFDPTSGSWAYVAKEINRVAQSLPTMNLGWLDDTPVANTTANERGVILHEFGHVLGLMHEHQSPVRGGKIHLRPEAVIDYYTVTQGWTRQDVINQILDVYALKDVSNFSELDLKSIMMYFMPPAMNEEGIEVKPNNMLSDIDKAYMIINYPHPVDTPLLDSVWTFEYALGIAGVDGNARDRILQEYRNSNWSEVRYQFTNWCIAARTVREERLNSVSSGGPDTVGNPSHEVKAEDNIVLDWCASQLGDGDVGKGAAHGVATINKDLWLPGDTITYSFIQGTGDATPYRQKRIADTFKYYADITNLHFTAVPFDPVKASGDIRIYFGEIPGGEFTGWSAVGKPSIKARQSQDDITLVGGSVESSMVLSKVIPKTAAEAQGEDVKRVEERTLYHEIGHALGLKHEHVSPFTETTDQPDEAVSVATPFDKKSVMLYADRELKITSAWDSLKNLFDLHSTDYNHVPSTMDQAFIGILYPFPEGHVKDRFKENIDNLGLSDGFGGYAKQRNIAFSHFGQPEFAVQIAALRNMIKVDLAHLVASRGTTAAPRAARGVNADVEQPPFRARGVVPPPEPTTGPFLKLLVGKITELFAPSSGQIFALQFPGRFLAKEQYAWDSSSAGIYGQFVKPTIVNESEFRLTDQLYNVGNVIGAPNGINLSIVYEQCLNNLVPGIQPSAISFAKQQDQIRKWLLREVPATGWVKDLIANQHTPPPPVPEAPAGGPAAARALNTGITSGAASSSVDTPKPAFAVANKLTDNKVNRMELANALMTEYLTAQQAWELERDEMIKSAKGDALEDVTRRLAHITPIREAQLASKYGDAVVRGYSHTIRQYLGYMDVKSAAESLQDAKDSLRQSASSSLDGSLKVYPVQMQPIDWYQSLDTNFTMEDLTADPDLIEQQIDAKSKAIDILQSRLAVIQHSPTIDLKDLQAKLDAAESVYDKAQAELSTTYTSNVISLAQTCINANNEFVMSDFTKAAKAAKIADAAFTNIQVGMGKLTSAQLSVTQASRAYTSLLSAKVLAEATDTTNETILITTQINSLNKDIAELTARVKALRYKNDATTAVPAPTNLTQMGNAKIASIIPVDILPKEKTSGGSRWQEFHIYHKVENTFSTSSQSSEANTSKTDCNFFFGSYHSESSNASSTSSSLSANSSITVEIGFRATLVTVDRSGWFQPQFFKQSNGFYHIDDNVSWSKWPADITTIDDLRTKGASTGAFDKINKYLLPTFPAGFLFCKDITIKVALSTTDIESKGSAYENAAASSGGILCWSTSSTHQDQGSSKSYSYEQAGDGFVIRIPGPQILGYMMQFTDPDVTHPLPDQLPDGFLIPDDEFDAVVNGPTVASHTVAAPTSTTATGTTSTVTSAAKSSDPTTSDTATPATSKVLA